jgi:ribosomal-protein-alanine N-acetyltransferase
MTGNIPHPYPKGGAVQWIEGTRPAVLRGMLAQFAVVESRSGELIGCMSLKRSEPQLAEAELAYWIGKPFWGQGYATEAAAAAIEHVRSAWCIVSLWAGVLPNNHRSARVLAKLGMTGGRRLRNLAGRGRRRSSSAVQQAAMMRLHSSSPRDRR